MEKPKKLFGLLLNQDRINDMSWLVGIYDTSEATLERVKSIYLRSFTSYISLYTSNEWNIPVQGRLNSCWNCRGPHGLNRSKETNNQMKIYYKRRKYVDDKEKSGDGWSDCYQWKKWVDKQNHKAQKAEKSSGIPTGVDSTGIFDTNGDWNCSSKKFGVNKNHTSGFHAAWQKEVASLKLPPTHLFSLNLTRKSDGGNKKPSVAAAT